ncbi:ribosomal protein L7/L12 [Streptomyces sp. NPDC052415]|uniref:ribosomal protein L7/L12 n=1 Tax=Streptomyces sp. NPDC052415 TaxID=3365690 RepID=UPI0037CE02D8
MTEVGDRRSDVVQAVRTVSGLSLLRSKLLLDALPAVLVQDTWFEAADDAAKRLEAAGARTAVLCGWCERIIPRKAASVDPTPCAAPYWPATRCRVGSPIS